jgi:hypothetical protein
MEYPAPKALFAAMGMGIARLYVHILVGYGFVVQDHLRKLCGQQFHHMLVQIIPQKLQSFKI